jgi:ABC-type multidrug transport system fused ATPase/permease subunit
MRGPGEDKESGTKGVHGERNSAKELLLADLEYFKNSFWKNEEIGEKRNTFFITLVTAALTFLGAVLRNFYPSSSSFFIIIFTLFMLLTVGIITLFRIIKRNEVTDKYKASMDHIRNIIKKYFDQDKCLIDYDPFKTAKKETDKDQNTEYRRKFGGLAHAVAALNSLIITALVALILWSRFFDIENHSVTKIDPIIIGSILAFVSAYGLQHVVIEYKEELAKKELKGTKQ